LYGSIPGPYTITGVAISSIGQGYTSAPTVTFSGGGGSGAAATASLEVVAQIRCGVRSGGTDTYGGTTAEADNPTLGTYYGGSPLAYPLPFQLCYAPDQIVATAQFRADGFDANQVGAGMATSISSSQCGVATTAASGAIVQDFRLSQSAVKQATCPVCAPVCGQWNYSEIDNILSYDGLCNLAPEQWILDLGGSGLNNGDTGITEGSDTLSGGSGGLLGNVTVNLSGVVLNNYNPDTLGYAGTNQNAIPGASCTGISGTIYGSFTGTLATAGVITWLSATISGGTGTASSIPAGATFYPITGTVTNNGNGTWTCGSGCTGLMGVTSPPGGYNPITFTSLAGSLTDIIAGVTCSGCSDISGEYTLTQCPWDPSGADHDPAPWANGQCYPAHPVPPSYFGAPNMPGGQCKWCYYGTTPLCDNETLFQAGVGIFPASVTTGPVLSLTVTAGGTGYTSAPTVSFSSGSAAATATISGSPLSSVTLTGPGSGYTSAPTIAFTGGSPTTPAAAVPIMSSPTVASVTIGNGGAGYTSPPTVTFSAGALGGTPATGTATINDGAVTGVTMTSGGTGHQVGQTPTVTFSGGGGSGATGTAVMNGATVTGIRLTNPGAGYLSAPTVTFSGGGASSQATATAATVGGYVSSIAVTAGGSYTANPTVSFSGGGGSGAAATASAVGVPGYYFQADLYISSLPIPNTYNSAFYNVMLWQAHYQSAVFAVAANPNCTDPIGDGLTLNLSSSSATAWFGGSICGTDSTGDPPSTVTLSY
jgi:hypothetical protein